MKENVMKSKILFLFLLSLFLSRPSNSQTFESIFSGTITNGATTTSTIEKAIVDANGANIFDTLKVYIQAGLNSTDSVRAAVYVQSNVLGRWSQGILIDSFVLGNTATIGAGSLVKYLDSSSTNGGSGVKLLADTLKNRWFYGQTISATAKTFLMRNNTWKFRLYAVGATSAPPLSGNSPSAGVSVSAVRLRFN